jgi:hypothetical protein
MPYSARSAIVFTRSCDLSRMADGSSGYCPADRVRSGTRTGPARAGISLSLAGGREDGG